MATLHKVFLVILIFLAVASGLTKILLMPQDVEFFGRFGFTSPLLVAFGASQVIGGVLMAFPKTRALGAVIVLITFSISAVMLYLAGNLPVTFVTVAAIVLLGDVIRRNINRQKSGS